MTDPSFWATSDSMSGCGIGILVSWLFGDSTDTRSIPWTTSSPALLEIQASWMLSQMGRPAGAPMGISWWGEHALDPHLAACG
jgi:hypothetical protein